MVPQNSQSKSNLFHLITVFVILALILAACGGQSGNIEDANTIDSGEPPVVDETDVEPIAPAVEEVEPEMDSDMTENADETTPTEQEEAVIPDTETDETAEDVEETTPTESEEAVVTDTETTDTAEDVDETDSTDQEEADLTDTETTDTDQMAATETGPVRVSELFDTTIQNQTGEELGQIEDVLIGLDAEPINYIVLAYDSLQTTDGMLSAIPLDAFQFSASDNQLVLDVDPATLESAPVFEASAWPDVESATWDDETLAFWERAGESADEATGPRVEQAGATFEEATTFAVRASELLNYDLQDETDQSIGTVNDILIDTSTDRIDFLVVEVDDEFELEHQFYAIPSNQFSLDTTDEAVVFNTDPAMLMGAPGFDESGWPDLSMSDWDIEVHDFWDNMQSSP